MQFRSMTGKVFRAVLTAIVLLFATYASAHPAPFSYLDIAFRGGTSKARSPCTSSTSRTS